MKLRLTAAAILILQSILVATGQAAVLIEDDLGGPLGDYLLKFRNVRDSGERVVIDGRCYSACTIVTGLIPADRICVTPRARLGFHAARGPDAQGNLATNHAATKMMYDLYPASIRSWLQRNGGLKSETIVLSGRDLEKLYAVCR